jgi:hypothetical protein
MRLDNGIEGKRLSPFGIACAIALLLSVAWFISNSSRISFAALNARLLLRRQRSGRPAAQSARDVQRCRAAKPSPLPALCHARCSASARGVPSMEQSKKIVAPQQFAIA